MMFDFDSEFGIYFIGILVLISVLMFAVIGEIVYIVRLQKTKAAQNLAIERIQEDLSALCGGTVTLGKHLTNLEEKTRALQIRQDQMELQGTSGQSYTYAKKMAKNGAQMTDLIEDCGIAQGEAELIFLSTQMDRAS